MPDPDDRKPDEKNGGAALIWGGTAFVAAAIIGFCVYIAVNNMKQKPAPAPAAVQERPGPVTQRVIDEPAPAPRVERKTYTPSAPAVKDEPEPAPATVRPAPPDDGAPELLLNNLAGTLKLHLPFMDLRNKIPLEHTCYRENASPAMEWEGAPPGTKSYVVFLERREAGKEPYVSWILFDIPGTAPGLAPAQSKGETTADGAKHANADHNNIGYSGPCELKGQFTYAMRVFALDTVADLPPRAHKNDLIRAMNGHIIDAAEQEFVHYYRL